MLEEREVINNCNNFLTRSDARFNAVINRALEDLQIYSGDFWNDKFKKKYKRNKSRLNLSLNNWNVLCNAISSPVSNSPWHTELCDKTNGLEDIQELIDNIESDNDSKSAMIDAFRKACLTGYGYMIVTTVADEMTGEPKIVIESANRINAVAFDPSVATVEGSDAEEGAILNFIPLKKAKRLYGDDVVPMSYPMTPCFINVGDFKQWRMPEDSVALISYYVKNESGYVDMYKICGDKVVEAYELPIKIIPIVRLAGNEIYHNGDIDYNGIVQQTMSLELGANIAYSTLIERCGRSAKANYLVNVDAIDGLEQNMAACNEDDSVAVLWKGEHQPVPLTEGFQTGDLQATVSTCRTLLEDVTGIPLTGIQGGERERTATEILRQQISKESNTANYYNNAFKAVRAISKIIIQMITGGEDLKFTLENGPSVVTRQMKARQELTALATIMPDNMKPVIAKYFADTLKDDLGEELSRNIIANLPPDVQFVTEAQDPAAIHMMNQMKNQMDEIMFALEQKNAECEQLRQQLNAAQLSMIDNREQRQQEWQKFIVSEQDKVAIESAKLGMQADKNNDDTLIKGAELQIKAAESEMDKQESESDAYIKGMEDTVKAMTRGA
jgi:hypothetical protein